MVTPDGERVQEGLDPAGPPGPRSGPEAVRPNYVGMAFLAFLLILGAAYAGVALSYGLTAETNPLGPGAAPAVMGLLLMAGCLILLAQEFRGYRRAKAAVAEGRRHEQESQPGARDLVKPILILLILVAGLMVTPLIGMMIAMPLVVLSIALFVERLKPTTALIMGAVTALMLWLVFDLLLSVRFPNSLMGL